MSDHQPKPSRKPSGASLNSLMAAIHRAGNTGPEKGSPPRRSKARKAGPGGGSKPKPEGPPPLDYSDDDGGPLAPCHRRILEAAAISPDRIAQVRTARAVEDLPPGFESWGAKAVPAMVFTWTTTGGRTVHQIRVDVAIPRPNGKKARYLFAKGVGGCVGIDPKFQDFLDDTRIPALLVEGTKQFLAVSSLIDPSHPEAVPFGIPGCWGWSSRSNESDQSGPCDDLRAMALAGRDVLVCFDADLWPPDGKHEVFDAAKQLREHLVDVFMVRSVRFLRVPGSGSIGIDDVLGQLDSEEGRRSVLKGLIAKAEELPRKGPRRPAKASGFFEGNQFLPADCWDYLDNTYRLAMSGDESVAVYEGGVYRNGSSLWWQRVVSDTLGNDFRPEYLANITKVALANLKTTGRVIPFEQSRPLINFRNGLLDAETLELLPHTPDHLSLVQFPYSWDPEAVCPKFDAWLAEQLPGQGDVLLDVASQMFDLSRTPSKIVFLIGQSKTGKSTVIRILRACAGGNLTSNVSLHDLSRGAQDRFASSSLFGKILNTYADLSADDLQDTSLLKVLTGGDYFEAQGKGSPRFQMMNQALLVFSANSVPAVSEESRTYMGRMVAFRFERSFLGSEDQRVEDAILQEAPGIVRRLVEALHNRIGRGSFLKPDAATQADFADRSDRVRLFLRERTRPAAKQSKDCIPMADLFPEYCRWVQESHDPDRQGRAINHLGKHRFNDRVRGAGVEEFKLPRDERRWLLAWLDSDDDEGAETSPNGYPVLAGGNRVQVPTGPEAMGAVGEGGGSGGLAKGDHPFLPEGNRVVENRAVTGVPGGDTRFTRFCPIPPSKKTKTDDEKFTGGNAPKTGKRVNPGSWPPEPGPCAPLAHPDPFLDGPAQSPPSKPAAVDLPGQQTPDSWTGEDGGERVQLALELEVEEAAPATRKRKPRAKAAAKAEPEALPTEADLGPLPLERITVRGDTSPLVMDLETRSAAELWKAPANPVEGFIRLAGTDHGVSASPVPLLQHQGPLVAHNGFGFDFLALARHHGLRLLELSEAGRLVDTMALALALEPPEVPITGKLNGGQVRKLYSLNSCAKRAGLPGKTDDLHKIAADYGKQQGLQGKAAEVAGYGLIPRNLPTFADYLRGDVVATRALLDHLCPDGELPAYGQREMRVLGRLVAGITLAGTRLDLELTRARFDEVEARKEACRRVLVDRYGLPTTTSTGAPAANPLNCTGAAEAITAAAADVGLELPRTEKTGKPSTSKEQLGPLLEGARAAGRQEQVDLLETILALTGARSIYGTALDHLQEDGRVHPQVAALQASGRFSITAPGITVFGKRGGRVVERAIFLPDSPDHVLVSTDLAQIDMRAMAVHCQDPAYMALFEPGRDAHSEIAAAVGLSREDAKRIGHGWNYGMSVNGMVRGGVDRAKAEKFDQGMSRRFPRLIAWRDRIRARAESGRRLDNGFGRMMRPNPDRAWTQAPALMGQGTARDLMMEAVLRLPLELVPMLRLLVHDELVFSIPLFDADRFEALILEAMNFQWAPPGARVPIQISADLAKRGRNWADCYRKE